MASQNSPTAQLEPIPAIKIRKSRKAPAIKTSVIIQRAQGRAKSHIARDLGITHNTVNAILEESDIERQLESGQVLSAQLIPDAIRVAKHRLSQNSENMAIKVLENTIWPLQDKQNGKAGNPQLFVAIQNLMQPTTGSVPADNSAEITVNSSQVVENKE